MPECVGAGRLVFCGANHEQLPICELGYRCAKARVREIGQQRQLGRRAEQLPRNGAGYFATIDCQSSSSSYGFGSVSCTDHKEILFVSLAGVVSATAVGTPLMVVGLRRRPMNEIQEPAADEPTLSFTLGPVSGLSLRF